MNINLDLYTNILMTREIQYKILTNPNYIKYLRENSYWYKELNRNNNFKEFENEVKNNYKLRTIDKIEKVTDTLDFMSKIMSTLK